MQQHEDNANEIFETFFQRVFQRSGGNAISHKRFMRAIEKAKNEMGFSVEEEEQFKGLWDTAKKDEVSLNSFFDMDIEGQNVIKGLILGNIRKYHPASIIRK